MPLGVKTVQLRLKDAAPERVRREIAESLEVCARHGCQLIVNDYWREALALGADYIHLGPGGPGRRRRGGHPGQGRAARHLHPQRGGAGHRACRQARLRGARAHLRDQLKVMKWAPQGLDRIADWKAAHRRAAAGRHRRDHAGAGRRRGRGRRRQHCGDHRLLHPPRSRGAGAPVACLGRARSGLSHPPRGNVSPRPAVRPVDCDNVAHAGWPRNAPTIPALPFG